MFTFVLLCGCIVKPTIYIVITSCVAKFVVVFGIDLRAVCDLSVLFILDGHNV